ncbi:DUF4224 domain-containing protein [Xenorhabdus bovienii]|uniref:DUF4224 domain-containing protein n=1 Tax=Xenorhabdus bovienii str. Intermedium TaxID=1379677 RepID=A0A077QKK7_XENBV|nr:DUF4224 domain-containing protein [Xenorhabdus bovienii]MDE9479612.1 DUF4224 domain-containing protein [Xenorhabdus bovienii]MDE9532539.1 DUF4224 domain-containing protein [Xenorhabdus bovienii]MDE9545285.1 DUF4224 domain-containing protein [Xenorhabdus bovienii]MDE9570458.1 DUF4224 domain-containing protein [Xenorhabdus bovienii]CDH33780.1 conserved hypothetical protein [Xenorhabdus bovienii str. Intermedium]
MVNHDCAVITETEMIELTGYKKPSKQCKALKDAGIFFLKRPDGRPRTTWGHFNKPLSKLSHPVFIEEPDFGAM